ncbi:unnamed protein product [Lasius platythorax]|uniref:Uncharacterized protein n=1 Tax=Lasius platythorax TaxID=488582 RepID=A0AAV2NF49_9HYME
MATTALTSPPTVRNCIGWTFGPLPQVGSPVGYLKTTPTGLDSATKIGCKSQSYTSWDCVSRLYVGGVYIAEPTTTETHSRTRRDDTVGDTPTQEEKATMIPAQRILLDKGIKIFVRGKGVLTRTQVSKLPQDQSQQTTSKAVGPGSSVQTRSMTDNNTGFFYSDIIPVRSVAVTTMICARETEPMPYSPQYQILAGRLNDPAQTGVLSAVVRGPNVRCHDNVILS